MRPIFLPDTAVGDDEAMVQEFYRHVYARDGNGRIFGPVVSTGPDSDVYAALYYSGEVRNGGHHWFNINSDFRSNILEAALSGLAEIGADPQHGLLSEMKAWTVANPHYVEMTMRDEWSSHPAMDALDTRFYAEQDAHSVEVRAAAWIKAYPDLRIVPTAEFMALLEDEAVPPASSVSRPGGARIGLLERVMTTIFGR